MAALTSEAENLVNLIVYLLHSPSELTAPDSFRPALPPCYTIKTGAMWLHRQTLAQMELESELEKNFPSLVVRGEGELL